MAGASRAKGEGRRMPTDSSHFERRYSWLGHCTHIHTEKDDDDDEDENENENEENEYKVKM